MQRGLLALGALAPWVGAPFILTARLAHPDYEQGRHYLSELGAPGAPDYQVFNLGIGLIGLCAVLAGIGNYLALSDLSRRRLPAALIGWLLTLAGLGLIASALIHWPDRRHYWAVQLALGLGLGPPLLIWCLWDAPDLCLLRRFMLAWSAIIIGLTLLTKHLIWPGVVNTHNAGWWEVSLALALAAWPFVLDMALRHHLPGQPSGCTSQSASLTFTDQPP